MKVYSGKSVARQLKAELRFLGVVGYDVRTLPFGRGWIVGPEGSLGAVGGKPPRRDAWSVTRVRESYFSSRSRWWCLERCSDAQLPSRRARPFDHTLFNSLAELVDAIADAVRT